MKTAIKRTKRYSRHKRVRGKIFGTSEAPRLCVFRASKHIYAQLIDDQMGKTMLSASDKKVKRKKGQTKVDRAKAVGKTLASAAAKKKIKKVVFDRGGYQYHGRVKALAEGAREGGLKF